MAIFNAFPRNIDQQAKQVIDAACAKNQQVLGLPRHEAFTKALKEHPEATRDMVIQHNLKHGHKQGARLFAERYED